MDPATTAALLQPSVEGYNIVVETVGDSPEGPFSACTSKRLTQQMFCLLLLVMRKSNLHPKHATVLPIFIEYGCDSEWD